MKKNFLFAAFVTASVIAGVSYAQQLKAMPEGLALQVCSLEDSNGKVISVGNTCISGSTTCISNPCPTGS